MIGKRRGEGDDRCGERVGRRITSRAIGVEKKADCDWRTIVNKWF